MDALPTLHLTAAVLCMRLKPMAYRVIRRLLFDDINGDIRLTVAFVLMPGCRVLQTASACQRPRAGIRMSGRRGPATAIIDTPT